MRNTGARWLVGCAFLVPVLSPTSAHAWKYTVECAEVYPSPCNFSTINKSCDLTDYLVDDWLDPWSNWSRNKYLKGPNAWPVDWIDDADGGLDWVFADDDPLAVWSGHGEIGTTNNRWRILFGTDGNGDSDTVCAAQAGGSASAGEVFMKDGSSDGLGSHTGNASFVAFDASCSMNVAEWASVWAGCDDGPGMMFHTRQGFGFNNSPLDSTDRLYLWGQMIDLGVSNKDAWLLAGGDWEDESPVAITKGSNYSDTIDRANGMNLKSGWTAWGPPPCDGYYWYFLDNGDGTSGC